MSTRREFLQLAAVGTPLALLAACGPAVTPGGGPTNSPVTGANAGGGTQPGAGATGGPPTLASAPPTVTSSGSASAPLRLPTYAPVSGGPPPDIAASSDGADAAYFSFPKTLGKSVAEPPAQGGQFTSLVLLTQTPPAPMDQNAAWQEINKQLGATANLLLVTGADYQTRLSTIVASGDLPDTLFNIQQYLPNAAEFMRRACADLTPYLGGDAIKDYPNLATFPSLAWKSTIYNERIYAVPIPRSIMGYTMITRQDMLDSAGAQHPKSAAEFKQLLQAFTHPQSNQYGISTITNTAFGLSTGNFLLGVFRAPNNWRQNPDGSLTKDFETDEFRMAAEFARDLVTSGVYHPNSSTFSAIQAGDEVRGGRSLMYPNTWGSYTQNWDQLAALNANGRMRPLTPFAHDGAQVVSLLGNGQFGLTYLKNAPADRVKLLLRVLNYLGAPFGSQENTLVQFGIENTDYTLDAQGSPVLTEQGKKEVIVPWKYMTAQTPVLYDAVRSQEFGTVNRAAQDATIKSGIFDPTIGLYSETDANKSSVLNQAMYDGLTDMLLGRRPMSDVPQLVKEWRSNGGDQVREEYQQALRAASSRS
jgi:putative aldouronate transport system substrate-binding protein